MRGSGVSGGFTTTSTTNWGRSPPGRACSTPATTAFATWGRRPSIVGTGTEDYFNNAWGFRETFSYPYHGVSLLAKQPDGWQRTTAYRFHLVDPVHFKRQIRVTLEHGWPEEVTNDYSSVAFWYQREVATGGPKLPTYEENRPRDHRLAAERFGPLRRCGTQFEAQLRTAGVDVEAVTTGHRDYFGGGYLIVKPGGKRIELTMPEVRPGTYRVHVALAGDTKAPIVRLGTADEEAISVTGMGEHALGIIKVGKDGVATFWFESAKKVMLDSVRLVPEQEPQ